MREESEFSHGLSDEVWDTEATLSYAMEEMESGFSHTFTSAQVSEFFNQRVSAVLEAWLALLVLLAAELGTASFLGLGLLLALL